MSERRTIDLAPMRADGWFAKLGEGSSTFGQLCDLIGEAFVAFAAISGVRIQSVAIDSVSPAFSQVEFSIGEGDTQSLALIDFQRRLCGALLADNEQPPSLESPTPSAEEIQAFIGHRYLLLAPIFGVTLKELRVAKGEPPGLLVGVGSLEEEVSVASFRNVILARIRNEMMALEASQNMALDLEVFTKADELAERGDFEGVVDLLAPWTTKIALMLRTGQADSPDVQRAVVEAMGTLGNALIETGDLSGADEVLRLGVQWAQNIGGGGRLFRLLGRIAVRQGQHGQAIGFLRRSVSLGQAESDVVADLARCYHARERWVATLVCAKRALVDIAEPGDEQDALQQLRDDALGKLGSAWTSVEAALETA